MTPQAPVVSRETFPRLPVAGAGILVFSEATRRVLLLDRADGTGWSHPGGWLEAGETPWEGALREFWEETGIWLLDVARSVERPTKAVEIERDGWMYVVFPVVVRTEAVLPPVRLNHEHRAYTWADADDIGPHLHPGAALTLDCLRRN
jgi:8-oxo-dGTP diphosphatase